MRRILVMALACAALLPAQAAAAVPMKAVIVHLAPSPMPPEGSSAREAVRQIEQEGRRAQAPVLAKLAQLRRDGHVRHVRPLWIASAVALSADASALAALEARSDVRSIEADTVLPIRPADAVTGEPGIASTGAPGFWARGVDGRGITVGVLDTGVDLTNPELAAHYRGGSNSWFDPYGRSAPADLSGHGTEVTGVIVAGAGIGMAPGAKFIAARAFDDAGASTASAIHLAFQWLLDPDGNLLTNDAPNVVNLSWGARQGCNLEFQPDLHALRLARTFFPSPPPATMVRPSRRRRPSRRTTRPPTFPRRSQSERWRAEQRLHRSRAQARQAAAEASSPRSSPRERASSRPAWAASTRQGSRERRSRPRTSRARSRCCSRSPRSSPPPSR